MAQVLRRRGRIQIRLTLDERDALTFIVDSLRDDVDKTALASPRAYETAAEQEEYARWVHEELSSGRSADIEAMVEGLAAGEDLLVLTETQAFTWLRALTHLRLAAGHRLGIADDGWEEHAEPEVREGAEYRMLTALGWIQEELIVALES